MTTTKKLMTAAIAVAALATASIASGEAFARGGHGGGGFRGGFHGGAKFFTAAGTSVTAGTATASSRRVRLRLQHLLEVHAVRPRERLPRAALLSDPQLFAYDPSGGMTRAGLSFRLIQSAAAAGFFPLPHALSLAFGRLAAPG